ESWGASRGRWPEPPDLRPIGVPAREQPAVARPTRVKDVLLVVEADQLKLAGRRVEYRRDVEEVVPGVHQHGQPAVRSGRGTGQGVRGELQIGGQWHRFIRPTVRRAAYQAH